MEQPETIAATEPHASKTFSKLLHSIELSDKKRALIWLILIWRDPNAIRNLFPDDEADSPSREIAIQQWILSLLPELFRLMLLDVNVSVKFQASEWMALLINTECLRHLLFPRLIQIILLKVPSASVPTPSNWNTIIPHVYYVTESQKTSQEEIELSEQPSNPHHRQAIFVMNYFSRTTATSFLSNLSSHVGSETFDLKSHKSIYWEGSDPILVCCFVLKGVLSFLSSTLAHSTAVSTPHVSNVLYWDGFIKQYFMRGTIEGTDHDDALCGSGYESLSQISEALWKEGGIMHALLLAVVVYSNRITSASTTTDHKVPMSTSQSSSHHHYAEQEQEQGQVPTATRHLSCHEAYDDALRGLRTTTTTTNINNNGRRGNGDGNDMSGYRVDDENNHAVDSNDDFGTAWNDTLKNNEDKVESLRALQSVVDLLQLWVNDDTGNPTPSPYSIIIISHLKLLCRYIYRYRMETTPSHFSIVTVVFPVIYLVNAVDISTDTAWKLQHFLQLNGVRVHINAYQRDGGVPGDEGEKLDVAATLLDLFPLLKGKLLVDEDVDDVVQNEDDIDGGGDDEHGEERDDDEEGIDGVIRRAEGRYSRVIAAKTLLATLQAIVISGKQSQQQKGKVFTPYKEGIEAFRYALEKAQQQQQQAATVQASVMRSPRYNRPFTLPLTCHLLHPLFCCIVYYTLYHALIVIACYSNTLPFPQVAPQQNIVAPCEYPPHLLLPKQNIVHHVRLHRTPVVKVPTKLLLHCIIREDILIWVHLLPLLKKVT